MTRTARAAAPGSVMPTASSSLIFWGLLSAAWLGIAGGAACSPIQTDGPRVLASPAVSHAPEHPAPPAQATDTLGDGTFEQPPPYLAPPETLSRRSGVPEGKVSAPAHYASRAAYPGLSFEYEIYVPAQYDPNKPAALIVFQDGVHYLGFTEAKFNSQNTFDNLIAAGEMPVTIALFINPGTPSGTYHYPEEQALRRTQYDALDDTYGKFLLDEIIPDLITSQYNIVSDPEGWAIGGHSSGGICAFTVAFNHPEKFRKVLTHNGSFVNISGGDAYPRLIRSEAPKPLRVMLLSGTHDISSERGNWLAANVAMAAALAEQHYHYRFRSGEGEHYPPAQAVADYPDALRWLWRGYALPK